MIDKKEITNRVDILFGLMRHNIKYHNLSNTSDILNLLINIINKIKNNDNGIYIKNDIKKNFMYQLLETIEMINDNHPLWNNLNKLYNEIEEW